jgi:hypothetical protein
MQQSHQCLACLPCACACACVGAGGHTSCVFVQEDGEEHRLVYAAYHPCATRQVPCHPPRPPPLPLCARPLSVCMFDGAGSAGSASGRRGARRAAHVSSAHSMCHCSMCHSFAAALVHTHTPFGISLLTCYLPSHQCLVVAECVLVFGRVSCLCLLLCACLCLCPGCGGVGERGGVSGVGGATGQGDAPLLSVYSCFFRQVCLHMLHSSLVT